MKFSNKLRSLFGIPKFHTVIWTGKNKNNMEIKIMGFSSQAITGSVDHKCHLNACPAISNLGGREGLKKLDCPKGRQESQKVNPPFLLEQERSAITMLCPVPPYKGTESLHCSPPSQLQKFCKVTLLIEVTEYASFQYNITIFGIIAVSLMFFMQFEFVCIPISTLTQWAFCNFFGRSPTSPPPPSP